MPATARRDRERAQRHQMIITAARELAEAEGWDAVTTRRLAERIEYSQPVLYSHFDGKDAIVRAVAIQGFEELADHLRRARLGADGSEAGLRGRLPRLPGLRGHAAGSLPGDVRHAD